MEKKRSDEKLPTKEQKTLDDKMDNLLIQVYEIKRDLVSLKEKSIEKKKTDFDPKRIEIESTISYIEEKLEESTTQILREIKSEFYRLINFLSGSNVDIRDVLDESSQTEDEKKSSRKENDTPREEEKTQTSLFQELDQENKQISAIESILQEREIMIYELLDQILQITAELKSLKKERAMANQKQEIIEEKLKMYKKLVKTDARYKILQYIRQMPAVTMMDLSFVLGVSLSQVKRYIIEMEKVEILDINQDGTIKIHHDFDESLIEL